MAVVAFAVAFVAGVVTFGRFDVAPDPVTFFSQVNADSFALVFTLALLVGGLAYLAVEYLQTGRLDSLSRQFDTRTLALMPVAIAINIVLGAAVANALKIPIYLDSIGTILVGALAGPIPGAVTGLLTNLLWTYVIPPPFQNGPAGAFAVVAFVIGILAGLFGRLGWLRPRPDRSTRELVIGGVAAVSAIVGLSVLAIAGYRQILGETSLAPQTADPVFAVLGWLALALVAITAIGLLALLFVRRDLTAAYVVIGGLITGIVAALISAPISAGVFGGVTGGGTDFLVLAFRQAGADVVAATLGQGLISDPIDKVTTFFVVYLILSAMARRTKARFPQGERLIERQDLAEAPA